MKKLKIQELKKRNNEVIAYWEDELGWNWQRVYKVYEFNDIIQFYKGGDANDILEDVKQDILDNLLGFEIADVTDDITAIATVISGYYTCVIADYEFRMQYEISPYYAAEKK